ncbi:serine O-acetyltransferase EpsC [Stratiformator vulcanicus]|uniref:Serine acetyltransferase n=1 Tax=Stratiformator vulcanicus TaxID=2527980 RepID=A0A517QZZ7_9PLAN|nr:serine O-acetyltransferase EpsC [Stratiformator vulcanicus]QDT37226.1 Serine acetyltransferase [Stratiformator vulcanicus]
MASDFRRKEQLPELTDRIVASYHDLDLIHHLAHCPLPSSKEVFGIVRDLKEVLFPGYRGRQNLHWANVGYYVGDLVDSLHDRMTEQLCRALRHAHDQSTRTDCEKRGTVETTTDFERIGQERAIAFLETLPQLRETLMADARAAYDGDPAAASTDEIVFCYPGFEAITIQRLAHELYRLEIPIVPRMLTEWAHRQTGIDIHPGAQIGRSFFIDHGTGVVIGETCEIADNVKIYQGVTLGAKSFPKGPDGELVRGEKRHPTVEEGVIIYSSASILGGDVVIGSGSVIGAGVTLTRSVPANTVVTIEKPSLRFREAS